MRAHRIAIVGVATQIITMDYLQSTWSLQFVVSATATYSVNYTADDPNDTEGTGAAAVWFPFPAALTGATTNQFFPGFAVAASTPQPIRAIQVVVTASTGSVFVTVLQASGGDGI